MPTARKGMKVPSNLSKKKFAFNTLRLLIKYEQWPEENQAPSPQGMKLETPCNYILCGMDIKNNNEEKMLIVCTQ